MVIRLRYIFVENANAIKKNLTEFLLSIQPRMEMKLLIFAKERKPLALK